MLLQEAKSLLGDRLLLRRRKVELILFRLRDLVTDSLRDAANVLEKAHPIRSMWTTACE